MSLESGATAGLSLSGEKADQVGGTSGGGEWPWSPLLLFLLITISNLAPTPSQGA